MALNDAGRYQYQILTDTGTVVDEGEFWVSSSEESTAYNQALAHADQYRDALYKIKYWRAPNSIPDIVNREHAATVEIALW